MQSNAAVTCSVVHIIVLQCKNKNTEILVQQASGIADCEVALLLLESRLRHIRFGRL